ncbi:MAG: hypothetical protein AB9921_08805 [Erysipelotrichaceae bacterium]
MAGNVGHPFFGNQYTNGNYPGNYHYNWSPNLIESEVMRQSTKILSSDTNAVEALNANTQSANKILPNSTKIQKIGKDTVTPILIVAGVFAAGVAAYFLYEHFKKKRNTDEEYRIIDLDNVGMCKNCDEILDGSEYIDENSSDSNIAYIICKKCGEKNYAWYPEGEDDKEQIE